MGNEPKKYEGKVVIITSPYIMHEHRLAHVIKETKQMLHVAYWRNSTATWDNNGRRNKGEVVTVLEDFKDMKTSRLMALNEVMVNLREKRDRAKRELDVAYYSRIKALK